MKNWNKLREEYAKGDTFEELLNYVYDRFTGVQEEHLAMWTSEGIETEEVNEYWAEYQNAMLHNYLIQIYGQTDELQKIIRYHRYDFDYSLDRSQNFLYDNTSTTGMFPYCKVYLPIKPSTYHKVFDELIDLHQELRSETRKELGSTRAIGQFKLRTSPANDAVVYRFNKREGYEIFIELLRQRKEIMKRLGKPNMFVPNIDGIGIIYDDGGSYIRFVTEYIQNYVNFAIRTNQKVNLDDFILFVSECNTSDNSISHSTYLQYKKTLLGKLKDEKDEKILKKTLNDDHILRLRKTN